MSASAMDLWSNTATAQVSSYQGVGDINIGQFVVSLVIVIGLLLACAWLVQRLGLVKQQREQKAQEPEERILYYNQFNADQTLVVTAHGPQTRCVIYRRNKIELMAELPLAAVRVGEQTPKKNGSKDRANGGTGTTFQDLIFKRLRAKDTNQ